MEKALGCDYRRVPKQKTAMHPVAGSPWGGEPMSEALVRDVMTPHVRRFNASDSIRLAAEAMEIDGVGNVVLVEDGEIRAIVTDRDIAVRAVAKGLDPDTTPVSEIANFSVTAIVADAPVEQAERLMRENALSRMLVVNRDMQLAGVVTLTDLDLSVVA
jgi:CBS domain-containing protein